MNEFAEWDSFYLIVGGAAGALVGLQFVVMTLIADRPTGHQSPAAGAAYATPTTIHFVAVLLVAAILRVPWKSEINPSIVLGILGVAGVAYIGLVIRRIRIQHSYEPVFEDWMFHAVLPLVAYATLAVAGYEVHADLHDALFGVGAAALLLLIVGIHNAWDMTTYNVFVLDPNTRSEPPPEQKENPDNLPKTESKQKSPSH